jgi:hypothetical protein
VLWSPDGSALAITDHSGGSESSAWVVRLRTPNNPEDLEAASTGSSASLLRFTATAIAISQR